MLFFINILCIALLIYSLFYENENAFCDGNLEEKIAKAKKTYWVCVLLVFPIVAIESVMAVEIFKFDGFLRDASELSEVISLLLLLVACIMLLRLFLKIMVASIDVKIEFDKIEHEKANRLSVQKVMDEKNETEKAMISALLPSYDKVILTNSYSIPGYKGWAKAFYVNIKEQKIVASGRLINFTDIISCSVFDNSQVQTTHTGTSTSETKANNGNVVGRAIMGGMVAGGVGAIIGGTTAKSNTTAHVNTSSTSRTIHDYTIVLNIKDILSPTCNIHCGKNEKAVQDIVSTVNAIIESNNK